MPAPLGLPAALEPKAPGYSDALETPLFSLRSRGVVVRERVAQGWPAAGTRWSTILALMTLRLQKRGRARRRPSTPRSWWRYQSGPRRPRPPCASGLGLRGPGVRPRGPAVAWP